MRNGKLLNVVLLATALVGGADAAYADDGKIVFSGNTGKGTLVYYGSKKKESYDVAVMLADKNLKGKKIEAVRAPFKGVGNIDNVKVWITKKLTLENKTNVPDVMSLDAKFDGTTATATLSEPYTIDCDTLYVGYTFDVTTLDDNSKTPVVLTTEKNSSGFFIHTSRTFLKWLDKSSNGSSAMEVDLSGVEADAASFGKIGTLYGQVNTTTGVTLTLQNHGYNGVKSINYSYTAGDAKGSGQVELSTPIPAIYNASADVDIEIDGLAAKGRYPVSITVDKVNGKANCETATESDELVVYNMLPKRNPVMEEYTGTWCGWCPRGFVALELMNKLHPDFIGLSYHNGDVMEVMSSDNFPGNVSGFPSADIDRMYGSVDPYYGLANDGFGMETLWKLNTKLLAPASAQTSATFTDKGKSIAAKATFVFPETLTDADKYKVEFVLLEDGLTGTGSAWEQHNYYTASASGDLPSPEGDPFLTGQSTVSGLKFDDVVVASTRLTDGLVSLPSSVSEDVPVEVEGKFDVACIVTTNNKPIIQDATKLRIVALLLNADGTIANAAKAKVDGAETTGIAYVDSDGASENPVSVYGLQGQRLGGMQRGVNIVKYTSGKVAKGVKR